MSRSPAQRTHTGFKKPLLSPHRNMRLSLSDLAMPSTSVASSSSCDSSVIGDTDLDRVPPVDQHRKPHSEPIKTFLRLKPGSAASSGYIELISDTEIRMIPESNSRKPSAYRFTKVLGPLTTQKQLFEESCFPMLPPVLLQDNFNALIFAYGASNSGKSHSVLGSGNYRQAGILPRTLAVIFKSIERYVQDSGEASQYRPVGYQDIENIDPAGLDHDGVGYDMEHKMQLDGIEALDSTLGNLAKKLKIDPQIHSNLPFDKLAGDETQVVELPEGMDYTVWFSCSELYADKIYDLLAPVETGDTRIGMTPKRPALFLKNDISTGCKYVHGLKEVKVKTLNEALLVLRAGLKQRQIFSTLQNKTSSRSHCVFTIKVLKTPQFGNSAAEDAAKGKTSLSRISIVDLAGSERMRNTQSTGQRLKEAGDINNSIMKTTPVPYHLSKLTQLFQNNFEDRSKNSQVAVLVNVNPTGSDYEETIQTLRFSSTAIDVTTPRHVELKVEKSAVQTPAFDTSRHEHDMEVDPDTEMDEDTHHDTPHQEQDQELKSLRQQVVELDSLRQYVMELEPLRQQVMEIEPLRQQVLEIEPLRQQVQELGPLRLQVQELGPLRLQVQELEPLREKVWKLELLREQVKELEPLRQQVRELESLREQVQELELLRKQVKDSELLRGLTSEMESLRARNKELEAIDEQNKELEELRHSTRNLQQLREQELEIKVHEQAQELQSLRGYAQAVQSLQEEVEVLRPLRAEIEELVSLQGRVEDLEPLQSEVEELCPLRDQIKAWQLQHQEHTEELEKIREQVKELEPLREQTRELREQNRELEPFREQVKELEPLREQVKELESLREQAKELESLREQAKELESLRYQIVDLQSRLVAREMELKEVSSSTSVIVLQEEGGNMDVDNDLDMEEDPDKTSPQEELSGDDTTTDIQRFEAKLAESDESRRMLEEQYQEALSALSKWQAWMSSAPSFFVPERGSRLGHSADVIVDPVDPGDFEKPFPDNVERVNLEESNTDNLEPVDTREDPANSDQGSGNLAEVHTSATREPSPSFDLTEAKPSLTSPKHCSNFYIEVPPVPMKNKMNSVRSKSEVPPESPPSSPTTRRRSVPSATSTIRSLLGFRPAKRQRLSLISKIEDSDELSDVEDMGVDVKNITNEKPDFESFSSYPADDDLCAPMSPAPQSPEDMSPTRVPENMSPLPHPEPRSPTVQSFGASSPEANLEEDDQYAPSPQSPVESIYPRLSPMSPTPEKEFGKTQSHQKEAYYDFGSREYQPQAISDLDSDDDIISWVPSPKKGSETMTHAAKDKGKAVIKPESESETITVISDSATPEVEVEKPKRPKRRLRATKAVMEEEIEERVEMPAPVSPKRNKRGRR
ncbi:hypothetical protein BGZ52_007451 [Haplosporangium bisporale]|nr:hypothetical protein BGZ52_007451 [Haplosporangium bisporale]